LYRQTAGNPFFVTEVLATGGEEMPQSVRDAVLARASRLSSPARALLEAVAIAPPRCDLWLLEALSDGALERFEECLASGMLEALPRGSCSVTSSRGWRSKTLSRRTGASHYTGKR
jgi:hypothetical protein